MNFGKFLTGFLVLALAFLFQVWFPVGVAGGGIHGDFVLAVLVAFVFVFPFWEFLFFVVLAAFVMNWQPGLSADLLAFALVPLAAFVLHLWVRWEPWIGVAVSTVAGILIFYGIVAPGAFFPNIGGLIADVIACAFFGEAVLWGMAS